MLRFELSSACHLFGPASVLAFSPLPNSRHIQPWFRGSLPIPSALFPDGSSKGHHVACGPSTDFAAPETCCATIDHFGVHDGAHVLDAHYLVKHDISTLPFVPRSMLPLHRPLFIL
ncbi:uncharacterized protein B0T23DRAFT_387968 [Neurospora hispaniola]|uniref:Uncharacterized protein n=1 Tax=Neurospora hispaniola TaxID=588809 RepID=A0AAJ0I0D3_9PEZI|nr:hypothetical protein B0T23DRAFT_387968 [Neurospora hispaniola]